MASSGSGHQLRYASVDLSDVSVIGGRSSTSTTCFIPCLTASCHATEIPAIPAPQITTSDFLVFTIDENA